MMAVTTRCWYILRRKKKRKNGSVQRNLTAHRPSTATKHEYTHLRIIFLSVPDARSIEVSAVWSCKIK